MKFQQLLILITISLTAVLVLPAVASAAPKRTLIVQPIMPTPVMSQVEGFRKVWTVPTDAIYGHGQLGLRVLATKKGSIPDEITGELVTWYKVSLPIRPNGRTGWVSGDTVKVARTPYYVNINRSQRKVRLYKAGKVVDSWSVVVAKGSTPTPKGKFSIYGHSNAWHGFDGAAILTFAYSNVHKQFDGGNGKVAMHGRSGASFNTPLGTAGSNGCVRMNNNKISKLYKLLPLGTPVDVV